MDFRPTAFRGGAYLWGNKVRTLKRNEREFYYSLFEGKMPIYDEYGNDTLETYASYSEAYRMKANISTATGQSSTEQFGNLDDYDKVIVTDWMECPIDENSVLFVDKTPEFDGNMNPVHDYTVRRIAKSINSISIAIKKVTVS